MISRADIRALLSARLAGLADDVDTLVAEIDRDIFEPRCSADACEKPAQSTRGGLCPMHLSRHKRRGSLKDTSGSYMSQEQRFWFNVPTRDPDVCWEYQGPRHDHGYGLVGARYAHRFSYELHHGAFPQTLHVRHRCDNPPCVNPGHLELGTHAENMRDMAERGRGAGGARAREERKLTPDAVRDMRASAAAGVGSNELMRRYGVTRETVRQVLSGKTWKDV